MDVTIYALVDPFTGKVRYVGKTVNLKKRIRDHLRSDNLTRKTRVTHWMMSILERGFFPQVKILEIVDESRWAEAERNWIGFYRASGGILCNHTDGGEGASGLFPSDETRLKLSEANRKRYSDPEAREKLSEVKRGRKHTPEAREKISDSTRKRLEDPDVRARMSEACRKRWADPAERAKLSETRRGKKLTDEHRAKISEGLTGRKPSAETKAKISEALRGWRITAETRAKLSLAQKARFQREREANAQAGS